MFKDGDEKISKIDASYTSRVAEIFYVFLKSLGIGLDFVDDDEEVKVLSDDVVNQHTLNGKTYLCTDYQFYLIEKMEEIKEEILSENPVLTSKVLDKMIEERMQKGKYIDSSLSDELGDLASEVKKENKRIYDEIKEELNKSNNKENKEDVEKEESAKENEDAIDE